MEEAGGCATAETIITVAELADEMGVSLNRAWQYVGRLEAGRLRLQRADTEVTR